jgi:uncharacterized membrane protein
LSVDVKGAAADGASIGASFAEGFKVGFDGRKVGEGILSAIKGVFKDAGTLFPGGKEASSTSWISAGLLTLMGIKGSKAIGTIFKGGKGIYNYGKGLLKGSNAADAAIYATKAVGAATGPLDNAADIAKSTAHLKDAAGSFRTAANASKEAEKAVKTAEVLKAAKQADLEKSARLLKELKKEAAKFGDDIPKGLSGKIKAADKAVTKGRVDVKKAASHLDDMVNMKSFKALEYANAREGFAIARDVANAAKATNQVGGAASSTGIFSKITGWLGKNSDNALIAGSQAAGKGIKGIPVLGTLLGLTASGAVVASAAPENRGRAVAGEAGSWLGAIGAGAGAGALVGTLGGGPIGTVAGSIAGGIGGAIGGEAFAEWLYDQKDAIGGFFSNTLPSLAGSAWDALKMGASDAGTWIADKWSGFSDWLGTSVWTPTKDIGISAANITAGAWSEGKDWVTDKWGDFSNWFDENAWKPVSDSAQAAGEWSGQKWDEARAWIGGKWADFSSWLDESAWTPASDAAQVAGQRVSSHWNDARAWVEERWSDFSGWFEGSIWGPVKTGAQAAGAWVSERWSAAKTWINEAWGTVSGWFSDTVWEPIKGSAQTAGAWLGDQFTEAKNAVSNVWSGVAGWFETNVWGPIKSGASAAWEWVGGKLGGIGEWIGDKWTSFKDWLGGLGQKGSAVTGLQTSQNKSSVLQHAYGGIMTKPHMGIVAEAGPEAIIPLSPSKRSGALSLWQQTGQMLGVTPHADGGIFGKLKSAGNVVKEFAGDKISAIGTTAKKAWGSIKTVFSTDKASAAGNTTESIAIGLESTRRGQENAVKSIYKPYQKKIASITSPDIGEYEKAREIAHMAKNLNRRFGKATKIASRVAIPLSLIASVTEIIGLEDKKRAIVKELGSVLGAVGVSALVGAGTGALVGAGVLSPVTALIGSIIGAGAGAFGGQAVANKLYDRFAFHAEGGIMTKPHMGIVAEDGAEGIIPLSPSKRSRGIDLWQRTGEILGVRPYEDGGIVGDEQEPRPKGVPTSRGGQNITIKVEVKAEPRFTIEGNGDTTDENKVLAVLKTYIREMTDDIGDELAERLARIFANMPMKGGAEA